MLNVNTKELNMINQYRNLNGVAPLVQNDYLCGLAATRIFDITKNFNHDGFKTMVCRNCTFISENLAENFPNNKNLLNAWIDSPGHNANLLRPVTDACVVSNNGYHVFLAGTLKENYGRIVEEPVNMEPVKNFFVEALTYWLVSMAVTFGAIILIARKIRHDSRRKIAIKRGVSTVL